MGFADKNKKTLSFCILTLFIITVFSFLFLNTHYAFALPPSGLSYGEYLDNSTAFQAFMDPVGTVSKAVVGAMTSPILWVFNTLLYAVWIFCALLLYIAGMLMDWAVNPVNFSLVAGNSALYEFWKIVRDFLNLAFILVLLFSAFSTIFQVEKYHLKKILLMLVIMALLVNFSFPIARFIIDTSNVLMYYILGTVFPNLSNSSGLSAQLTDMTSIVEIVSPNFGKGVMGNIGGFVFDASDTTVRLVVAIFFTSLVAITLLVIAALLVIRIVVLAILIVFSPIGFVGVILPSAKSFADSWWDQLFKQAFFGPIMVFMLALSLKMMNKMSMKSEIEKSISQLVNQNDALKNATYSQLIVTGTYLAIPVTILWLGLIAAQKIGAHGADAVIKKATGSFMWAARYPGRALGIEGGMKQTYEHYKKKGVRVPFTQARLFSGDKVEEREAKIAGFFKGAEGITPKGIGKGIDGWKGAVSNIERKRGVERADELKKLNTSASDAIKNIESAIKRKDNVEATGNAIYMTEKGLVTDAKRLAAVLEAAGKDEDLQAKILEKSAPNAIKSSDELESVFAAAGPALKENVINKVKKDNNLKILIEHDINKKVLPGLSPKDYYKEYLGKLSPEDLAKQKGLDPSSDSNFKDYLVNRDPDYVLRAADKLSGENLDNWHKAKVL